METVLTAPAASETQIDSPSTYQSAKKTRQKKKSIISGNRDHPGKAFITPLTENERMNQTWEYEGWRYVEKSSENGRVKYERVPLTTYELLHPQEGYVIVHKSPHDSNTERISTGMKTHLLNIPNVRVLGDLRTDLNLPGIVPISPDVSVVFGVSKERIWSTFDCQEEGIYPSIVFEVTSPGTRSNDFEEKYDYYCRVGIPYYVILDIQYGWDGPNETATYHLHVFERVAGQYEEMQANTEGRYWLPPVNMWLGVGDEGILFYDETGKLVLMPEELKQTLDETEQQRNVALNHADEQERIARREATRAAEQESIAQKETARAAEQERIAQEESARAAEQERIAQQERALAQEEAARAAELERIAQAALEAQLAAEAKVTELLAQMAALQAESE